MAKELSAEEMNALVSAVMRHMLFKPKDAGPMARTELVTLINTKYKGKRNLTNVVIALAQVRSSQFSRMSFSRVERKSRSRETAPFKTDVMILRLLLPHNASSAPWSSPPFAYSAPSLGTRTDVILPSAAIAPATCGSSTCANCGQWAAFAGQVPNGAGHGGAPTPRNLRVCVCVCVCVYPRRLQRRCG